MLFVTICHVYHSTCGFHKLRFTVQVQPVINISKEQYFKHVNDEDLSYWMLRFTS